MADTTGQRLRSIRGDSTQADFADLLGVSRKTLIRYEADEREPDVEMIVKLNLLFGIQPLWLLTGKLEPTSGVQLSPTEYGLLDSFRRLDAAGRSAVDALIKALQQQSSASTGEQRDRPAVSQTFHSKVGQVAAGDIVNQGSKKR